MNGTGIERESWNGKPYQTPINLRNPPSEIPLIGETIPRSFDPTYHESKKVSDSLHCRRIPAPTGRARENFKMGEDAALGIDAPDKVRKHIYYIQ